MQEPDVEPFQGIPEREGYVLTWIRKDKLHELNDKANNVGMELLPWACKIAGCSAPTLKKKLERYRDVLDMSNGGCVRFSTGSGSPWKFQAPEFRKFVLQHKKEFAKAEDIK